MFELCEQEYSLPLEREHIRRLMTSFNEPVVAAPRHSAQQTHAYICTFKEDEGLSVYIYLYLTLDKVGIIYKYAEEISASEGSQPAEDEAVLFAEDMGFMIDDLKFDELDTSQQDKLLSTIPMFKSNTTDIQKEDTEEIVEALLDEPIETAEAVKEAAVIEAEAIEEAKKEIAAREAAARQVLEEAAVREAEAREAAAIEEAKKEIAAREAAAKEAAEKILEPERRLSKFRMRSVADRLKKNKV